MTVVRREDVQSKSASWDNRPYRIANSPVLRIVPRIIRRLDGPFPVRPTPLMEIEPRLRKVMGYRHLLQLREALQRELKIDRKVPKTKAA